MKLPLQTVFRGMEPSQAVEDRLTQEAERLEKRYGQIMGCRVVVEFPHKHHHQGRHYHVRIDLTVPGGELVAGRDPDKHAAHEDVYVAIRDAFLNVERQLEHYAEKQRGDVKVHSLPKTPVPEET